MTNESSLERRCFVESHGRERGASAAKRHPGHQLAQDGTFPAQAVRQRCRPSSHKVNGHGYGIPFQTNAAIIACRPQRRAVVLQGRLGGLCNPAVFAIVETLLLHQRHKGAFSVARLELAQAGEPQ